MVLNQYLSSPNYFHRHFSWTGYVVRNSEKKVLMYCLDWNVHINVFILSGFSLKMPGYNINISISIQVINTWQMVINEVFLERLPKMMLTQPQLPSTVMYNGRKDILNGICVTAWGWHGLTDPSKVRRSYSPASWVHVTRCWILSDWGRRIKITGAGLWRGSGSSLTSSWDLVGALEWWWLWAVCKTMVQLTQRMKTHTEYKWV